MCQGEHGNNAVAALHVITQHFHGKEVVGPQGAVGKQHALGVRRGAAGIVNESQRIRVRIVGVGNVLLAEILGIFAAKKLVEVLASLGKAVRTRYEQRIVGNVDDTLELRHGLGIKVGPNLVASEEQTGTAMVDNVVHLMSHKLVQDGHSYATITERGQESRSPVGTVATAECYLVAAANACIFKKDVEFFNFARYVFILQRSTLVVGQRIKIPVCLDALFYQTYKIRVLMSCFHAVRLMAYAFATNTSKGIQGR